MSEVLLLERREIMVRILIADDYWMIRNGLHTCIEEDADLEVIGEATNGEEAVEMARRLRPDMVLMDALLPVLDGIATTSIICNDLPETKVVLLSTVLNGNIVVEAFKAGASGYLLKNTGPTELRSTIKTIVKGRTHLSFEVSECLIHQLRHPQGTIRLTDREMEVLQLLTQGCSNRAITLNLHISEDTVKSHVRHILSKLGVETRTQAALAALRLGLVDSPVEENIPVSMQRIEYHAPA